MNPFINYYYTPNAVWNWNAQMNMFNLASIVNTYSQLSKLIDAFFADYQRKFNEYESTLLQELETNESITEPKQPCSIGQMAQLEQRKEEIQSNRIKSNTKKKIAKGRICAVNCIEEGRITKGLLVVFRYYNIKLYLGPFDNRQTAEKVQIDFRKELFKLQITKSNYKEVIDEFYSEYKKRMESQYKVMVIYHKNDIMPLSLPLSIPMAMPMSLSKESK